MSVMTSYLNLIHDRVHDNEPGNSICSAVTCPIQSPCTCINKNAFSLQCLLTMVFQKITYQSRMQGRGAPNALLDVNAHVQPLEPYLLIL